MRIGILFGGISREREVSYLGGKTAMQNIDKELFTPVPVFVDGRGNFILIREEFMYEEEIRAFYPTKAFVPETAFPFSIYVESLELSAADEEKMMASIGQRIFPHEFGQYFDYAFIAMHGPGGEDGSIQGLLEWYNIPYHGPDVLSSGISMDKIYQNELIAKTIGLDKKTATLTKDQYNRGNKTELFRHLKNDLGLPFVVKAPHQGSSIGVSFVKEDNVDVFEKAVKQCLFIQEVSLNQWNNFSFEEKGDFLQKIANLDEGIAFPLALNGEIIKHPQRLWEKLDAQTGETAELTSVDTEDAVLFEAFVNGQEFSCGVIQDADGHAIALPPTEIVKLDEDVMVFDFKTKYKKSTTRKNIPINTSLENNQKAQQMVRDCFRSLKFGVCTRIDGFLTLDGRVILHDPNTIPGMSPASLIFKQMAEIGLNVTNAITYFIRASIRERIRTGKHAVQFQKMLENLDAQIAQRLAKIYERQQVALIFDDSPESYAEAKKAYSKLSASAEYHATPIFFNDGNLYELPVNLMFKETVTDLKGMLTALVHPLIVQTRLNAKNITQHFAGGFEESVKLLTISELTTKFNAVCHLTEGITISLAEVSI